MQGRKLIELCPPIFPWVENRGYCAKIHNAMSVLSDGTLLLAEGNHFTWDGIPVTVNYFNRELPESMLYRKRAGGYPNAKYEDFGRISDYGFHNMLVAPNGVCYAAWVDKADGALKLLRFNPDRHRLDYLDKMILKDPGAKVAGNQGQCGISTYSPDPFQSEREWRREDYRFRHRQRPLCPLLFPCIQLS
ncbi:MAG: hypothetical protein WCP55_03220 [Lentisphaerota bacterium]